MLTVASLNPIGPATVHPTVNKYLNFDQGRLEDSQVFSFGVKNKFIRKSQA